LRGRVIPRSSQARSSKKFVFCAISEVHLLDLA
jgi:hypothetical protein